MLSEHRLGYWVFGLSLFLCLIPLGGHANQKKGVVVVPVEDESGPGSPLQVSGHASFLETVNANELTSSRSEEVRARNISGKPILLFVASFEDAGPKSGGEDFDLAVDSFLKEKAILPGEDLILLQRPFGEHYTTESFGKTAVREVGKTAFSEERPPKALFHLRFVQFSDGSTFGDPVIAAKWLDERKSTMVSLKKLRQVYEEQGEAALLQALEQDTPGTQPTSLWSQIRELRRTSGAQAAVTLIDHLLLVASQHDAELGQSR